MNLLVVLLSPSFCGYQIFLFVFAKNIRFSFYRFVRFFSLLMYISGVLLLLAFEKKV